MGCIIQAVFHYPIWIIHFGLSILDYLKLDMCNELIIFAKNGENDKSFLPHRTNP